MIHTNLIASSDQNTADSIKTSGAKNDANDLRLILAVGFQWKVSKADVAGFFAGVNIIGGNNGIQLKRNRAMEAMFVVRSGDIGKALAYNKRSIGSRTIYGMRHFYKILYENV